MSMAAMFPDMMPQQLRARDEAGNFYIYVPVNPLLAKAEGERLILGKARTHRGGGR